MAFPPQPGDGQESWPAWLPAASRDAMRRFQQALAQAAPPRQPRGGASDANSGLGFADQVKALTRVLDTFGPPGAQIEALQRTLTEQRAQLQAMQESLERVEATVERLAASSELLASFQEPYARLVASFGGFGARDDSTDRG